MFTSNVHASHHAVQHAYFNLEKDVYKLRMYYHMQVTIAHMAISILHGRQSASIQYMYLPILVVLVFDTFHKYHELILVKNKAI